MPTLIREGGFEVRIYTRDHPPPHVHVAKAGAIVKVELWSLQAVEIAGVIPDRDVIRAERLVARHARMLAFKWGELCGKPERKPS